MRRKIVIIGPVYPYKGGISQHTGMLYRELVKYNDVTMISYKLQYPKLLFKKGQKDFKNDALKIDNTEYLINTANPFNWISSAKKIRRLKPDLIIIQWWHPYFSPCYWALCKMLKKYKKLFICHNVFPHERFPMDRFLTKHVLANGDGFIVHSKQDEKDLLSIKNNAVFNRTVLPVFNSFKINNLSREDARRQLDIQDDEKILLFFGLVREYKGLKYLLKALPQIVKDIKKIKLFVVGDFNGDKQKYLDITDELGMESFIEIRDGYVPDAEVEKYFMASDLVVLPYISATQSAVVQTAYSFEKPVIVTNVGGLPEVVKEGETGYIVEPENSTALASAVLRFFNENKADEFKNAIQKEAERYSWERMSENVNEMMDKMK